MLNPCSLVWTVGGTVVYDDSAQIKTGIDRVSSKLSQGGPYSYKYSENCTGFRVKPRIYAFTDRQEYVLTTSTGTFYVQ